MPWTKSHCYLPHLWHFRACAPMLGYTTDPVPGRGTTNTTSSEDCLPQAGLKCCGEKCWRESISWRFMKGFFQILSMEKFYPRSTSDINCSQLSNVRFQNLACFDAYKNITYLFIQFWCLSISDVWMIIFCEKIDCQLYIVVKLALLVFLKSEVLHYDGTINLCRFLAFLLLLFMSLWHMCERENTGRL